MNFEMGKKKKRFLWNREKKGGIAHTDCAIRLYGKTLILASEETDAHADCSLP